MLLPTLYKQKNDKVLFWQIETGSGPLDQIPIYVIKHGYVGGKTQTTFTEVRNGKNQGKANETTAIQQCDLEAKALWQKQIDHKGYVENLKADNGFKPVKPMLAHSYDDHPHKLVFPCYVQAKYDGIRCVCHIDNSGGIRFFSRQSSEFLTLSHLKEELQKLNYRNIILDGELYSHKINFQEIISAVKRDEVSDKTPLIEYIVYDAALSNTPYEKRLSILSSLLKPEWNTNAKIKVATTYITNTLDQIEAYHKSYTDKGYEGVILRNSQGLYVEDKRSYDLLKYKKFQDAEFEIVGIEMNKGKLKDTCVFVCKTKKGTQFKAMPEGTQEQREQMVVDWNSGKIKTGDFATIKYFSMTTSDDPVPRFPILKCII